MFLKTSAIYVLLRLIFDLFGRWRIENITLYLTFFDRLVIFTMNQDIGLSAGNQLCGNLTGQHGNITKTTFSRISSQSLKVYLDVDPINIKDPIRLFIFAGNEGSFAYKWNIKITLIDCTRNEEIQGIFHLQYFSKTIFPFPSSRGVSAVLQLTLRIIRVFQFRVKEKWETNILRWEKYPLFRSGPGSPYLANTNYAVCFRPRSVLSLIIREYFYSSIVIFP